ncbi:MAG: hypothetical protein WC869_11800 [Phycisphaerae bacterium]|jgi:hypothetical protein
MKVTMRRTLKGFEPLEPGALRHVKIGDIVTVDVAKVRSQKRNAWFWALISLVHANLPGPPVADAFDDDDPEHAPEERGKSLAEKYPTPESLVAAMKVLTGWCDTFWLPDGREVVRPRSIAFHAMDELQFAAFCDRCMDLVSKYLLPGVNPDDLRREIDGATKERNAA